MAPSITGLEQVRGKPAVNSNIALARHMMLAGTNTRAKGPGRPFNSRAKHINHGFHATM
ncbi:hypothetical protein [Labrenzia sp. DG1229]|uniref:hypothetical protein n=1 Tax=Labrenzia sp. DG1229 TaxID=681847 RepID=UPI000B28531B|nr:hypothetical protein [Labrenzia sp. DG1229]